jgi:hypothetical protein
MSGFDRRFDPDELRDPDGAPIDAAEAAAMIAVARDLEAFAGAEVGMPSSDFEDRVMAAVANEAPYRAAAAGGFLAGLIVTIREAWRTSWAGDRPMAVRAQSLALVMLVFIAVGSTGTLAAVGMSQFLGREPVTDPNVVPSPAMPTSSPAPEPSRLESPPPTPSPAPTSSPSPTPSAEPTETDEPSETAEPSDDHGGGTSQPATPKPTARPTKTPHPTETPDPEDTPEPEDTPHPTETPDHDETA